MSGYNKSNHVKRKVKSEVRKTVKKMPVWAVILLVVVLIALAVLGYYLYKKYFIPPEEEISGEMSFHFLELGNKYTGDCTLVKVGNTEVLIDAGSKTSSIDTIDNYVKNYCTDGKLEYVIVTHAHEDHYACFTTDNSLFNRYDIGTVIDFAQTNQEGKPMYEKYQRELGEAIESGATHYTAKECRENGNYVFNLSDKITMTVLDSYYYYNKDSGTAENNHSVCTLFTQGGRNFLFTGDLEKKGEEYLVEMNTLPEVELYKAGHHGSRTSSHDCLLEVIKPKRICVCCCAGSSEYRASEGNEFPTQEFVDRVSKYTKEVYVTTLCINYKENEYTSMNGNIVVVSGEEITVNCSNNNMYLKDTDWFKEKRTCPTYWVA